MKLNSVLFSVLVLITAGVSYRWGSMFGPIFFIVSLMTGALIASHWARNDGECLRLNLALDRLISSSQKTTADGPIEPTRQ